MAKAFRIRRFSRAQLQKTFLRTEVQLKANGHLNTSRFPGRTTSSDNLPNPNSVDQITATSTTLTYKTVSGFSSIFGLSCEILSFLYLLIDQGMSTPQPRVKQIGALPINHLNSAFLKKSDVSHGKSKILLLTLFFFHFVEYLE